MPIHRTLPLALLLVAAAGSAHAAIVATDLSSSPVTLAPDAGARLVFELGLDGPSSVHLLGSDTLAAGDGYDFNYVDAFHGWELSASLSTALGDVAGTADGFPELTLFSSGTSLGGETSFFGLLNANGNAGAWVSPGTTGYVGLAPDSGANQGWALVSYNLDHSLTLYGFAVDTTPGESLLAGQTSAIPESGTTAAGIGAIVLAFGLARRFVGKITHSVAV